jgi:hypothetical protein
MVAEEEKILGELTEIRRSIDRIRKDMVTKDEVNSLMETVEILAENPSIIKEIDEALAEFKKGKYYRFEDLFGEKY